MSNLYYLGPEETFSHRAATRMARPGETLTPCADFREVFRKTAADPDAAAVVPFENTTQGTVVEVLDLLAATPALRVVACRAVPVHQHLLTKDLTTPVSRILSKAEALAQCRATLARIYPGIPLVPVASTAEAARLAACDPASAAVAGETTAKRYGLVLRRPDVQDATGNTTRFFRLEPNAHGDAHGVPAELPPTHALIRAAIDDRPGSLLELLTPLRGVDLTFIQSRPIPGEKWKYAFFLELLVGASGQPLAALLGALKAAAREVRLLGAYTITTQSSLPDDAGTTALSSLRAMIADVDSSLLRAFAARSRFRLNPGLYAHAEPIDIDTLARAFAHGDATEQTRALRRFYLTNAVPYLALPGDDPEPRAALHADTDAIAALARRFRFASRVIARKRVEQAPALRAAAQTGDPAKVEQALLNAAVEQRVLERAQAYAQREGLSEQLAKQVSWLYRDYLLPISRLIQVHLVLDDR